MTLIRKHPTTNHDTTHARVATNETAARAQEPYYVRKHTAISAARIGHGTKQSSGTSALATHFHFVHARTHWKYTHAFSHWEDSKHSHAISSSSRMCADMDVDCGWPAAASGKVSRIATGAPYNSVGGQPNPTLAGRVTSLSTASDCKLGMSPHKSYIEEPKEWLRMGLLGEPAMAEAHSASG